jgi:hypothetical protein
VNPCLAILALIVPFLRPLRRWQWVLAYVGVTAIGIMGIYAVAALDHEFEIWSRFGGDYSTHTAFAASLVLSLVFWKPARAKPLCVVLAGYVVLILVIGYHSLADIVTSAAAALVTTLPALRTVATRFR